MKIEEYTRLKSKIDALRQQKARAEGVLEQAVKKLVQELGVPESEVADRVADLEESLERQRRVVGQKLKEFVEKWSERLEEVG